MAIIIGGASGVTQMTALQRLMWLIDHGVSKTKIYEQPFAQFLYLKKPSGLISRAL